VSESPELLQTVVPALIPANISIRFISAFCAQSFQLNGMHLPGIHAGGYTTLVLIPALPAGNFSIVPKYCSQFTFKIEVIRTGILELTSGNQVDLSLESSFKIFTFQPSLASFYQCIVCSVPVQSYLSAGILECFLPVATSSSCSVVVTWKNFQVGSTVISFKASEFSIIFESLTAICLKSACYLSFEGTNLSSVAHWNTYINGSQTSNLADCQQSSTCSLSVFSQGIQSRSVFAIVPITKDGKHGRTLNFTGPTLWALKVSQLTAVTELWSGVEKNIIFAVDGSKGHLGRVICILGNFSSAGVLLTATMFSCTMKCMHANTIAMLQTKLFFGTISV